MVLPKYGTFFLQRPDSLDLHLSEVDSSLREAEERLAAQRKESFRLKTVLDELEMFRRAQKENDPIPVLVIACNRPNATSNHVNQLLRSVSSHRAVSFSARPPQACVRWNVIILYNIMYNINLL